MAAFLSSISAVGLIFLMTAVGFFFGRAGWMQHTHKGFLVRLIMDIAMPAMCANSLMGSVSRELLFDSAIYVGICFLEIAIFIVLSFLVAKGIRLPRERVGVFVCMASFSNSMFIGLPMCTALFGDAAVPYVLCYYIANTFMFQLLGVAMLNHSGEREHVPLLRSLKKLIRPPLCAILACIPLILWDVELPAIVMQFAKYMGNLVSPLALLYTGFVIYELGLSNIRMDSGIWLSMAFRFIAAPVMLVLLCKLFQVSGLPVSVLMIEISMPVMTQVVVLSADTGADERYAAIGTAASTLACFVVVPILMLFV